MRAIRLSRGWCNEGKPFRLSLIALSPETERRCKCNDSDEWLRVRGKPSMKDLPHDGEFARNCIKIAKNVT